MDCVFHEIPTVGEGNTESQKVAMVAWYALSILFPMSTISSDRLSGGVALGTVSICFTLTWGDVACRLLSSCGIIDDNDCRVVSMSTSTVSVFSRTVSFCCLLKKTPNAIKMNRTNKVIGRSAFFRFLRRMSAWISLTEEYLSPSFSAVQCSITLLYMGGWGICWRIFPMA